MNCRLIPATGNSLGQFRRLDRDGNEGFCNAQGQVD